MNVLDVEGFTDAVVENIMHQELEIVGDMFFGVMTNETVSAFYDEHVLKFVNRVLNKLINDADDITDMYSSACTEYYNMRHGLEINPKLDKDGKPCVDAIKLAFASSAYYFVLKEIIKQDTYHLIVKHVDEEIKNKAYDRFSCKDKKLNLNGV